MKYEQTKLITYTDKRIKDDSWNEEDECIYNAYNFLMYALEKRLQKKNDKATEKAGHPFIDTEETNHEALLKYFAILMNDTLEKVETDKSKWVLNYIRQDANEDYIHYFLRQANTVIYQLTNKETVLTVEAINRNEAIAKAKRPFSMALAFKNAVIAGRQSFTAGRIEKYLYGNASSPKIGIIK